MALIYIILVGSLIYIIYKAFGTSKPKSNYSRHTYSEIGKDYSRKPGTASETSSYDYSEDYGKQSTIDEPYSLPTIESFTIAGIYFSDWNRKVNNMWGYVSNEGNNKHDKFAVQVLSKDYEHIGYIPRGENVSLHLTLKDFPNEQALALIDIDKYHDELFGDCSVFLGYDEDVMNEFVSLTKASSRYNRLSSKLETLTDKELFSLLDLCLRSDKFYENYPEFNETYFEPLHLISVKFLTSKIKALADAKEWDTLSRFDKYIELLRNEMSDKFFNAALKRIEKAKSEIN